MRENYYSSIPIERALYEAPFIQVEEKISIPTPNSISEWEALQKVLYEQEMSARG